jgi:hypothetical protein
MLYPTMLEGVLAVQERTTLCIGCGAPVPLSEIASEFEALLMKETALEAVPVACGVNVSATAHYCRLELYLSRSRRGQCPIAQTKRHHRVKLYTSSSVTLLENSSPRHGHEERVHFARRDHHARAKPA